MLPSDLELQKKLWAMPLEQLLPAWDAITQNNTDRAAVRTLCLIDLFYLNVAVLGRVDMLNPWIYARCREVEQKPNECIDLWSRGHYKTSIITTGLTIQEILKKPDITIIIFSNTASLAEGFLTPIKNIFEKNDVLKSLFSDILYEDPVNESPLWTKTAINVKTHTGRKEPTIETMGFNTGIKVGRHADLLLYDDIVTDKSVGTKEQIENTTKAYEESLSLGTFNAIHRMAGTRWHFNDTYSQLIAKKVYLPRIYPATKDGTMRSEPVLMTPEQWASVCRGRSTYVIACQYLLNPQEGSVRLFKVEDLYWYDVRPARFDIYILGDPGRSLNQGACDTALVVLGVTRNKQMYILDGYCHQMSLVDKWENLKKLYSTWSTYQGTMKIHVHYESIGNDDVQYFNSMMGKGLNSVSFKINELTCALTGSNAKAARIERLEPDVRNHHLMMPYDGSKEPTSDQIKLMNTRAEYRMSRKIVKKDAKGELYDFTQILLDQLQDYPFGAKVDAIDALSRVYDVGIRKQKSLVDQWGQASWTVKDYKPYQYRPINGRTWRSPNVLTR